jgi:hypothetical protein
MMNEIELTKQSNLLLDRYCEFYVSRYGVAPIGLTAADRTILRDLVREVGLVRAEDLCKFYFEQKGEDDWFLRRGHSIAVFRDSLSILNALMGRKSIPSVPRNKLRIAIWTSCKNPRCNNRLLVEGDANEVERLPYSQYCEEHRVLS